MEAVFCKEVDMPSFLSDLIKSRRFWVSVGGIAVVVFKDRMGLPLSEDQILDIAVLVGSWVVGESLRSSSLKNG
jgi:phosphate/sulfate permease